MLINFLLLLSQITNWYTGSEDSTGYLQWKPVCYLAEARARDKGTEVTSYDLETPDTVKGMWGQLDDSLARMFYGSSVNGSGVEVKAANVSFGLSQDGWYLANNYTAW